ncbi:hypothetical protein ACEV99_22915, partial [Vibrio parahaemolyticus]
EKNINKHKQMNSFFICLSLSIGTGVKYLYQYQLLIALVFCFYFIWPLVRVVAACRTFNSFYHFGIRYFFGIILYLKACGCGHFADLLTTAYAFHFFYIVGNHF